VIQFEELLAACAAHAHSEVAGCSICVERLTEATALYRGELLQELFLAQPFEGWLLLTRKQFADGVGWMPLASIAPATDPALQSDALGLTFDGRRTARRATPHAGPARRIAAA
jgi:hypothetical protein